MHPIGISDGEGVDLKEERGKPRVLAGAACDVCVHDANPLSKPTCGPP